jgi:integrase
VFKSFSDEAAALAFAEEKDVEIANHGVRYGDIPPEVRRAYDYFRDQSLELTAIGATVPRFEDLVAGALSEIRTAHQQKAESQITVAEAVQVFLAYKQTRVKSRQLTDLTVRLTRFARDNGTSALASITAAQAEKWLTSLRSLKNPEKLAETPFLSPLSRNHYRAALHAFFAYASAPARALCPINPISHVEPEKVETSEPQAYTPQAVAKIMQMALDKKPDLVPALTLGFFCGLRVSEAIEADLSSIKDAEDEFRITRSKSGTRMAPLTAAAAAWLKAQPRRTGKAWTRSPRALVDEMQELFTIANVTQINNGARHSFITYRAAQIKSDALVAEECGNSARMIKVHYRKVVSKASSEEFFAIRPENKKRKSKKIVSIKEGVKSA